MPMIPLSIVLAGILGYYLLLEFTRPESRNNFVCGFLILLMIQLVMAGVRFGYGVEAVKYVYPYTAALIAPLAYLSFKNPVLSSLSGMGSLTVHLIPLLIVTGLTIFAIDLIDPVMGIITLGYAIALIYLGIKEKDTFPWVDFNQREYIRRALWCVVALAIVSALTDFIITYDSWHSRGANIPKIVGGTTILIVVLFVLFIIWQKLTLAKVLAKADETSETGDDESELALIKQLDDLICSTRLHLDSDLNLNRIARKLGIPARQVSVAINRQKSLSVSQFINNLRIEEACRLLKISDMTITSVMLQSGFITKSNFNREFNRQKGVSPSAWRKQNRAVPDSSKEQS